MASSDVVQWASTTSMFWAPVSTPSMPRLRALMLAVLGCPQKAAGEPRIPVVTLAFTASTTVVVIVAMAAMDVSRRRVMAVMRHPFSIHDSVVPRVDRGATARSSLLGGSSTRSRCTSTLKVSPRRPRAVCELPLPSCTTMSARLPLECRTGSVSRPRHRVPWCRHSPAKTSRRSRGRKLWRLPSWRCSRSRRGGGCPPGIGERGT